MTAPHEQGLATDLDLILALAADRRRSLRWLLAGGAASMPLLARGRALAAACQPIPAETAGPFPADGSDRASVPDVLTQSGIVRSDIRASFGAARGRALGIPLAIELELVNAAGQCAPLAGHAVYLWQCDRDGRYSLYMDSVARENYLRGVQVADGRGRVAFQSIFPACYLGRMTHVHLEVYPSLAAATGADRALITTQFTFPMATMHEAFGAPGYASSQQNLARTSYADDIAFHDGTALQIAAMRGNPRDGYTATLQVAV